MRKLIVVSRRCWLERKRKLLISPFRLVAVAGWLGETVRKPRTFFATGSQRFGETIFPGNAVRHCTCCPPTVTVLVVDGSKICPFKTGVPSQGLMAPVGAPRRAEKSPFCSSAWVGIVPRLVVPGLLRY